MSKVKNNHKSSVDTVTKTADITETPTLKADDFMQKGYQKSDGIVSYGGSMNELLVKFA